MEFLHTLVPLTAHAGLHDHLHHAGEHSEWLHMLQHAVLDSLKALPFLFLAYLLIEYLEHKASAKMKNGLHRLGPYGPIGGALLGILPQCGFSVAASNFYAGRIISVGTLLAVFLSTSDEAIPILLSQPGMRRYVLPVLGVKLVSAILFGFLADFCVRFFRKKEEEAPFEELCAECDCDHHGVFRSALHHTVRIFLFILLVNLLMELAIHFVGEEKIAGLLLSGSVFQPFLTALIGLIPNCAASVILTELFMAGSLTFGSCIAGLCAGAGMGVVVLFRTNRRVKENLLILAVLYGSAVLTGLIVNLF